MHSPIGAHCSFTLGCKGKKGGLGLELAGPAYENVYIGLEEPDRSGFKALPFFEASPSASSRYDHGANTVKPKQKSVKAYADDEIKRVYKLASDEWQAGDLRFSIYSPVVSAPDPSTSDEATLKHVYCPAVFVEIEVDNRAGESERKVFFGYQAENSNDATIRSSCGEHRFGIGKGQVNAIYSDTDNVQAATGFCIEDILSEKYSQNYNFGLGNVALLMANAPAGEVSHFRFAVCFYRAGIVTTGMETAYLYSQFFSGLSDVGSYALDHFSDYKKQALESNLLLKNKGLSEAQSFQLTHAIRSYYGSTQLLRRTNGEAIWVVNEGEYRMMNTFDLTVDQLFYEMKMNPWTVKNELELFVKRYSYQDELHFPGGENIHKGGLSFTHDMGQFNHFSEPAYSAYECFGLTGCFSHMSHEQLVNWVLCAAVYAKQNNDIIWLEAQLTTFESCLNSMLQRDNPDSSLRNGMMSLDSSRTLAGAEITTYDSLDESLGQARDNVYMAVKCWASYIAMQDIYLQFDLLEQAEICQQQASLCAQTISEQLKPEGFIPALMSQNNDSKIIPAIEGLVFPYMLGLNGVFSEFGQYSGLIKALKTHFKTIMKQGVCLYDDGAWKLSSTADNSWLSKIYICQFVARQIFNIKTDMSQNTADKAHQNWLLNEDNLEFAWSDQMASGIAMGSKYYPRGVSAILWLSES